MPTLTSIRRDGVLVALALTLAGNACSIAKSENSEAPPGPAKSRVAARIGAETISVDDLDVVAAAELFEIRSMALHHALTSRLIQIESRERGIQPSQLREQEIDAKVPLPSAEEARAALGSWVSEGKLKPEEAAQMSVAQTQERLRRIQLREREELFFDELHERRAVLVDFGALGKPELEIEYRGPALGNAEPELTIVEFSDFTKSFTAVWQASLEKLVEKHQAHVRFLFKQKPATTGSPAAALARAALCADDQHRYWDFRKALFSKKPVTVESILPAASSAQLDTGRFEACLASSEKDARLAADGGEFAANGLEGDPVVVVNGIRLSGAHPFATVDRLIRLELKQMRSKAAK